MDKTDKTQKGSPAFIVKVQHKKLRTKFLKNPKNSKLIWEQVLKNADNLKEYASAMDILSRNWATEGDGISRIEWAKNWTLKWFNEKRSKVIRRNEFTNTEIKFEDCSTPKLKILDVGSCNGLFGEEVEKSSDRFEIYSIDIAPANEKVIYSDFSDTNLFERKSEENETKVKTMEFIENSFDQVSFLYLLSYMPDPILRFQSIINALKLLRIGGQLLIATPDSANQNKHQFWMRDWFDSLDKLGFRKHSYSKEKHFHGLCLYKYKNISDDIDLKSFENKFYILHDKHDLDKLLSDEK